MSELFSNFRIWPTKNNSSKLKANGQVTVADAVDVKFSVLEGKNGVFAVFPSQKAEKEGKPVFYPYIRIQDKEMYSNFQDQVKAAYIGSISDNFGQEVAGEEPQALPKPKKDNIPF